jgi:hypothetical protein
MRTTESSPALIIVLLRDPQTALLILPVGPVMVSTDSPLSTKKKKTLSQQHNEM